MKDPLSRPRVFRALVELLRAHPEPMNATQFMDATGYFSRDVRNLLRDLRTWGLVTISTRRQGRIEVKEIRLTPGGLKAAELAQKTAEAMQEAQESAPLDQGASEDDDDA